METKNIKFFEDIFPLRSSVSSSVDTSPKQLVETSSEPMRQDLRRSKRQRIEKSFGDYFYTYHVEDASLSYSKVVSSLEANLWEQAINIEIDSIKKNKTWTLVDLPKGAKPIGCKWIFKIKYNHDGSIDKYKARLVAKGFSQKPYIDYFDTFAPVTRISSIQVLIA